VSPAKAAELIKMLVGLWTGKGGDNVLGRGRVSPREGEIWG